MSNPLDHQGSLFPVAPVAAVGPAPVVAPPTSEAPFRLRPGARASQVSLFEREVHERLSATAVDLLLDGAQVLSEGGRARSLPRANGGLTADPFFGCTMLTIDLASLAAKVREPADGALATRVARLLTTDARAGQRVRALAEREACRVAGARVEPIGTEVRVRAMGSKVHVDVDLEGTIEVAQLDAQAGGR